MPSPWVFMFWRGDEVNVARHIYFITTPILREPKMFI